MGRRPQLTVAELPDRLAELEAEMRRQREDLQFLWNLWALQPFAVRVTRIPIPPQRSRSHPRRRQGGHL